MHSYLKKNKKFEKINIFSDFDLTLYEKYYLIAIFIFKSVNKHILIDSKNDINFSTSDDVLNEFCDLYNNFYVFYIHFDLNTSKLIESKKEIFKIIEHFVLNKIIYEKKSFSNNISTKSWSFNFENLFYDEFSYLKASATPFRIINIRDNSYGVGNFFTLVKKIYNENKQSGMFFKIADPRYTVNLFRNKFYLNIEDLRSLLNIFKKRGISHDLVVKKIEEINDSIIVLDKKIMESKKKIKLCYIYHISSLIETNKNRLEDELEIRNMIMEVFNEYFLTFNRNGITLKTLYDSSEISIDYDTFKKYSLNYLYNQFILKFSGTKAIIFYTNKKDLSEKLKSFKKYDYDKVLYEYDKLNSYKFTDIKETSYKKKKFEFDINSSKISFLLYIIILTKNEINEVIYNYLNKKFHMENLEYKISDKIVDDLDLVESYKYVLWKYSRIEVIKKHKIEINEKEKELRLNKSEISKLMHIYNLFLLEKYCSKKNMINKIDNYGNIPLFFLNFFDFRGRRFEHSQVAPTSNKYSRFIFNYGYQNLLKVSDWETTKCTNIIMKYDSYIDEIFIIFKISDNRIMIRELVYWCAISIGKIVIEKKNISIEAENFLIKAIEIMKEKPIFKSLIDEVEYEYYIKILYSINGTFLRRCLVKDATASFFQNLVRILGAKNDILKSIANLHSETRWYDWYVYTIVEWLKIYELEANKEQYNFVEKIFIREILKKVIMTFPYSASYNTCLEYFKENLLEVHGMTMEDKVDLLPTFNNFYKFLSNQTKKNGPYKKEMKEFTSYFLEMLKKEGKIVVTSRVGDLSDLTYYKWETFQFDLIIADENNGSKRKTKNIRKLNLNILDHNKIKLALNANLVQYADALLVRDINTELFKKYGVYYNSIHDCFMVDCLYTSSFIEIANNEISKNVFNIKEFNQEENYFSPFVFL